MATPLVAAKKELRKRIRDALNKLSEATAASQSMRNSTDSLCQGSQFIASNAIKTLLSMPEYQAARRISVYLSMPGGEISTSNIVHDALNQGKKVFIPYTYSLSNSEEGQPKSIMDMVELRSMSDLESLAMDKWGIPTPSEDSISSRANCFGGTGITNGDTNDLVEGLDLIVMPGMAFDASFGRLGHGKGFYDYFLTRCHQASRMPFRGENYWYYICGGLTNHVKLVYH
jgi:5-formyltetrahydrofolate cyclo-ligase